MIKTYYPTNYTPIHEVKSWLKVRKIIRAVRAGESIPPILVGGANREGTLLAGTHRCAANDIMDMLGYPEDMRIPIEYFADLSQDKQDRINACLENDDYTDIQDIQEEEEV